VQRHGIDERAVAIKNVAFKRVVGDFEHEERNRRLHRETTPFKAAHRNHAVRALIGLGIHFLIGLRGRLVG
jgi:hypothetical protein